MSATLFQSKTGAVYELRVWARPCRVNRSPKRCSGTRPIPTIICGVERRPDCDYLIFGGEDCKTGQEDSPEAVFGRLEKRLNTGACPIAQVRDRWLGAGGGNQRRFAVYR